MNFFAIILKMDIFIQIQATILEIIKNNLKSLLCIFTNIYDIIKLCLLKKNKNLLKKNYTNGNFRILRSKKFHVNYF